MNAEASLFRTAPTRTGPWPMKALTVVPEITSEWHVRPHGSFTPVTALWRDRRGRRRKSATVARYQKRCKLLNPHEAHTIG